MSKEAFIWAERFRPATLNDVIIPDHIKDQFKVFIEQKQLPNLLLTSSSPGTGKTTTAYALCNDIGVKPYFLNASLNNSIDDIRMSVMSYATTMSMFGGDSHKVVIFDEADRLSAAAMDALKGIIEEVYNNCRFILTANAKSKIIEPLQSRLTNIDFRFTKEDSAKMTVKMFKRSCEILDTCGVTYSKPALANIVKTFFPDNRRLLTFLQMESATGTIDEGTLAKAQAASPEALIEAMKTKKYKDVQGYVVNNADRLSDDFYMKLFKLLESQVTDQSIPQMVLVLGDYQKYDSVVPDKTIHYLAMCTELMMQIQFK